MIWFGALVLLLVLFSRDDGPLTLRSGGSTLEACIDRDRECGRPTPETVHYVVVRADLRHGSQLAQVIHAAGESAPQGTRPGTIAVALHARDEEHLLEVADALDEAGLEHHVVVEDDGRAMSLGVAPTTDRAAVRAVLGGLPLAR